MEDKVKKLSESELEIMLIVWSADKSVTSNYILEHIKNERKWVLSTLMTVLARLEKKKVLVCDRSTRTNYYSALISEDEYKTKVNRSFMEKLYGNSVSDLVASLYNSKTIDKKDLVELRELINRLDKENQDGDQ